MPRMGLAAASLVALLAALTAAPAHASFFAEAEDPAGDVLSPDPAHDITAFGIAYDRKAGLLHGAVRLRGAPDGTAGHLSLILATRTPTGCGGAALTLATPLLDWGGDWFRFGSAGDITGHGDAIKRGRGRAITELEATDKGLRGLRPDCAIATLSDPQNPAHVYDIAGPVEVERRPALGVRITGIPSEIRAGRTYRMRVVVENPGEASTGKVRIRLKKTRGVSASRHAVTVAPVAAGKRRTATIRVRATSRARATTTLEVTGRAGRLEAAAERRTFVRTATRKKRRGGGGGSGTPSTCVRYIPDLTGTSGGSLGLVPCTR